MNIVNNPSQRVTVIDNIVPESYVKSSTLQKEFTLTKGSVNTFYIRPAVITENTHGDDEIQDTVDAATVIIGQVFKASADNINGVYLTLDAAGSGSVDVKLWDMGTTIPVGGVTTLDSGTQYTTLGDLATESPAASYSLPLTAGKKMYFLDDFTAGVAEEVSTNALLNVGNYYALTLHYVNVNTDVYGPLSTDSIQRYANGFAFSATSTALPITQIGTYNDIMFGILAVDNGFIHKIGIDFDDIPGSNVNASCHVVSSSFDITSVLHSNRKNIAQYNLMDLKEAPSSIPKGSRFVLKYQDDILDSTTKMLLCMCYLHEQFASNG